MPIAQEIEPQAGAPGRVRAEPSWPRRDELVLLTAALAWAAGFVHAVASIDHFRHYWLSGVFFVVVAVLQVGWGTAVYRRPSPKLLLAGAAGSLAIAFVWVVTRTIGPPVGPEAWRAEALGIPDLAATLSEGLTAALVVMLLTGPASDLVRVRGAVIARLLAYALLVSSLLAAFLGTHHH